MSEFSKRLWSQKATLDDIYYCYRILLAREPSDEDMTYWSDRVAAEQLTYSQLAAYFRKSKEFVIGRAARGITLVALDDFELYVQEYDWDIGENIIQTRQYEPHVTAFLKQHLRERMTFVDVGANIGFFTLTAATQVGDSGKIIAVECNPNNCELMYMSLHRNGFHQVTIYPFAISDTRKLMSLSWGFSNGIVNELTKDDEESLIIPAVTLDSLLQNEPRVDVIKMDIEGSEAKAWKGMQHTVEKHYPILLMEFFPTLLHQVSAVRGEDLLNSILAHGYSVAVLGGQQELLTTSSTLEVMDAWRKRRDEVGDEAKTYLDLVFIPEKPVRYDQ
jgi:FkbM family methyltransferase